MSHILALAHVLDLAPVHAEKVGAADGARREMRLRDLLIEVFPGSVCLLLGSTLAALAEKTFSHDPLVEGSQWYLAKSLSKVLLPLASLYSPGSSKADRLLGSYVSFCLSNHAVRATRRR